MNCPRSRTLIPASAPLADAPFQAAYAEADITPPLGGSMPGYFQDRRATGVLDPLTQLFLKTLHHLGRLLLNAFDGFLNDGNPLL